MKIEIIHDTKFKFIPEGKTDEIWIENLPKMFDRKGVEFEPSLMKALNRDNPYEIMIDMQRENREELLKNIKI
jgi:hypothetical protein